MGINEAIKIFKESEAYALRDIGKAMRAVAISEELMKLRAEAETINSNIRCEAAVIAAKIIING